MADIDDALDAMADSVPLADACVTEWRGVCVGVEITVEQCHSLMLVLLNGGCIETRAVGSDTCATR